MRPARETREICKPYLRGECVYHARCLRYHVDIKDEEGSAPAALSDTSVAEPSSQSSEVEATLPRSVADGGSSHDEPRASPPSGELPRFVLLEEQVDHRPARVLNTVCYAYHFGSCKYGDACERTHALPERVVLCTNVSPSKLRDHVPKAGDNKEFPKANDVDQELMDFNGQRREDSIAAPLTVRAAQDQPRHLPHNVALLPRASNTSSRKGMRRGGQISSLMNSDQAISRRPLTDVLDASANLPAPPGKGTIPSDLLASIRPQPTCMQLGNQCHTERSTGDVFSATSAMEDSTASIHRSHRLSEERNGHGKTRSGKSTDVPSSELRDAVLDDMQRNMDSCSPSTAHLLDVFFGGPSGARMSNVGPRLWSSMDIPRHLERASKDHSDGLSKLSSSSSGHSFELDDSVCKTSPHSSVSSLPSPHTSPEPMSLAYDVLQPTTGHRLHDESTPLKQHSEAKVERNSTNAIRGNVDHTEARPPRSKTRPERRPAVPLIDASRQVNVPLVPPGLGLESKVMPPSHPAPPRETANPTFMVLSSTRVTYGPGFEVCSVTTGFEPREVMLTNLPRNVTCAAITAALQPFGVVTSVSVSSKDRECKRGTAIARVTFATPDQARQAIAALDDAELFDTTVNARLLTGRNSIPGKARLTDGDVLLEFPCPHKTAYVGYSSLAVAEQAISKANGTELKGNWVTAKLHEGLPSVGSCTVQMCGLPVDTEVKDFNRYGKFEDIMFQRPNYTSLRSATDTLRNKLEKSGGLLSFNVLPPPYKRSTVRVYAHFDSAAAARRVCANFHNTLQPSCGYGKLYAKYAPALLYSLPAGVYDALAADIHLLTSYVWKTFEPGSSISVVDRRTSACSTIPVTVKLASQRMQSLTKMKSHFEPLLRGEKVTQDGEVVWDGFFARSGGAHFLEGLERRHAGVIINKDPRRRTLALFGPARKRETVRSEILAKVTELRKQKTQVIPLPGRLIGLFCGSDLANLQWRYGQDNIELDPWGRVLRVRGEDDVYDAALLAMKRVRDRHSGERQRHQVECPVCFDDVVSPIKLECGHTWCKSCLQRYLRASVENKSFPLTCLGDEARCSHRIPISVAQDVLSTKDFEDVVHASFRAYVHSRPLEYHYCPTPDCEQVYRVASEDSVLQCPSCLVRICPKCHSEYHEGNACRYSETVSQMLFEEWKGSHDVKDCPNCKMTIEREAGCNHMQCTRCQTHICWNCRATFDTSGEVYEHMRLMHGGIGL
ncbi:hypothetical protein DAEQUDRAFT_305132 [Daedalea quercina L-15889]|uniref:RING-type E3 ubiquitin transferase n=1 Tax=Daedalea quercina L-15889 TaxID=1314783 RepID=A0A165Q1D4_9APHY|nr:hypothetical protein DAEQUDRAFT_305132 [Daedalea quercina L-15889]